MGDEISQAKTGEPESMGSGIDKTRNEMTDHIQHRHIHSALWKHAAQVAAGVFQVPESGITGRSMKRHYADARMCLYLYFTQKGYGPSAIARRVNRDHSTVLAGVKNIQSAMDVMLGLAGAYKDMCKIIDAGRLADQSDGGNYAHVVCLSPDTTDFLSARELLS